MKLDSKLLWQQYESEFSSKFRNRINPNGAISDLRVNSSRRGSYGIYDYREMLARHLKGVGIAVMLYANSEDVGREFYGRIFTTIDDLLPQFTEDDAQKAEEYEKKDGTYMSNQAFGSRAEKTLEILKEKRFYEGLDRVYATFEILRFLTIDKKRDEEPSLVNYIQRGYNQDAKDYVQQQMGGCKERIVLSINEIFQRENLPAIDSSNAILGNTETFESAIRNLSSSHDLGFGMNVMFKVTDDIKKLERYRTLSNHFDDGLERVKGLLGGIPLRDIRKKILY